MELVVPTVRRTRNAAVAAGHRLVLAAGRPTGERGVPGPER
ncbi:MAG TPA: hypothetical protein VIS05_11135 [Ilumatobacter sp.]